MNRRNWRRHVSGASFSCLVCATWTKVYGDQFLVPETWAENFGRVPWALHRSRASRLVCYTMLRVCSSSFVRIRISLTTFTVTIRRLGLLTCNKHAWHETDFHFIYCRQKRSFKVQMRKNPFSAGAPPRTLLGELTTLPQTA